MTSDYANPVRLSPVHIAKPWGQEIWFTGMEARGESQVVNSDGQALPISRYLSRDPEQATRGQPLLLLKILDPKAEPVLGDLYFEVHEEKREVYVVTHIAAGTQGAIRFGMDQAVRASFASDAAFRRAYLEAVQAYERVRRRIDSGESGFEEDELTLRAAMNRFTKLRDLHVGDVVSVSPWTPHALQHGVRVVEFQTQTYERFIVSFAQQVVTQDHWDTAHAVAHMRLDPPDEPAHEVVQDGVERIARFDHFNAWRVSQAAGTIHLPQGLPYAVAIAVGGSITVGGLALQAEEACLIPAGALTRTTVHAQEDDAVALVAAPGL